jgi:acetyltransferase-like isoleucine patch superfamily enzyme
VVNLLEVMAREPGLGPDDHMLSIAPIAFDMSVVEIFLPLSVGAQVEILPRDVAEDGERLVAHLVASKATAMNATPTSYRLMVESGWPRTPGFTAMSGGEPMPRELANAILERADELWNLYGPTETTVYCTTGWNVPKGDAPLHVGIPMANTRAYVVDPRLELLPIGVPGELAIGGVCVARGYHARPDLTAERFIERSFDGGPAQRLYRSGDICRWKEDGTIEVLGRIDHQVKIRGFRVELGEIEGVIDQHPAVRGTVVMAREDTPGDKRLVAYMVLDDLGRAEESLVGEVRDRVREALPAYMMPAAFVVLDRFTRTANGKIDRKALPAPKETATRAAGEFRAPATPLETAIAEVWQEVIGVEQVGVDDDYFDLGGHSLLVQRIRNGLEERIGRGISTVELYRHPTVAKLAAYFEGADPDGRPQDTAGTGSQDDGVAVVTRSRFYRLRMTTQRFLLPGFVVSLYYYLRDRATVSPRAEVELSPLLRFGRGSVVGSYAKIKATAGPVVFGERCGIGNASFITGDEKGILIGDNFVCGPNTTIISSTYVHDRLDVHIWDQGLVSTGIRIGHNVWIGASVTVLDGTDLGDNTIVVANSVVDRKHPPNVVLRGNPAEVIGVRD